MPGFTGGHWEDTSQITGITFLTEGGKNRAKRSSQKNGAVEVQKGAKRVLFPPDIDHQLPKFDGKCYVFMA